GTAGALCAECWERVVFLSEPDCAACGHPFEYAQLGAALCAGCMADPPPYTQARAVLRYDEHSRALITRLKYADQGQLAAGYGAWLAARGQALLAHSDVIVPVPLHYWRFVQRRYNQSALLAYALAKKCPLKVIPDALTRTRHTRPQAALSRQQRQKNVRGAFAITARHAQALAGKRVLLIDDVMTTAATIHECTKALLGGGAAEVRVLTLARKLV
ncbi:MAG: ComF family protein, partial [Proteobacteria bacterium]|nr:ComF family protein [Pseudomonadota bacterium]